MESLKNPKGLFFMLTLLLWGNRVAHTQMDADQFTYYTVNWAADTEAIRTNTVLPSLDGMDGVALMKFKKAHLAEIAVALYHANDDDIRMNLFIRRKLLKEKQVARNEFNRDQIWKEKKTEADEIIAAIKSKCVAFAIANKHLADAFNVQDVKELRPKILLGRYNFDKGYFPMQVKVGEREIILQSNYSNPRSSLRAHYYDKAHHFALKISDEEQAATFRERVGTNGYFQGQPFVPQIYFMLLKNGSFQQRGVYLTTIERQEQIVTTLEKALEGIDFKLVFLKK